MYFSCFAKKSTKRRRLKEALRKGALLKNPPAASLIDTRKCSDFRVSTQRKLEGFEL